MFSGGRSCGPPLPWQLSLLCSEYPIEQRKENVEVGIFVRIRPMPMVQHVMRLPGRRNPAGSVRSAMDFLHADEVRDKADQHSREYSGIEHPLQDKKWDRVHRKQNDDVERIAAKEIQVLFLVGLHGGFVMIDMTFEKRRSAPMQSPPMETIFEAIRPD